MILLCWLIRYKDKTSFSPLRVSLCEEDTRRNQLMFNKYWSKLDTCCHWQSCKYFTKWLWEAPPDCSCCTFQVHISQQKILLLWARGTFSSIGDGTTKGAYPSSTNSPTMWISPSNRANSSGVWPSADWQCKLRRNYHRLSLLLMLAPEACGACRLLYAAVRLSIMSSRRSTSRPSCTRTCASVHPSDNRACENHFAWYWRGTRLKR